MNWSEFVVTLLEHDLRVSSLEASNKTGIRQQVIDRWKRGGVNKPQRNTIKRFEEGLGIKINDSDPNNITYSKIETNSKVKDNSVAFEGTIPVKKYPLLAEVYAGDSKLLHHDIYEEHAVFTYDGENCFAVRVNGKSMETTLNDGDVVLCDVDLVPEDGDLVAVKLKDGKQFIKRFHNENFAFIRLSSDNPDYGVRLIDKNDIEGIYPVVQININIRKRRNIYKNGKT